MLKWPELDVNLLGFAGAGSGWPAGTFRGQAAPDFRAIRGDHTPTKNDWLKYLILRHPMMTDFVKSALEQDSGEALHDDAPPAAGVNP